MRKRKKLTPRNKYPEPVTYHEHPISISNAVGNNENLFQQTRNTFEKIETSYSNIVKQNPKNVVIFTDSMLKSLRMEVLLISKFTWRYCSSQAVPRIKGKADGSSCHTNFEGTSI